MIVRRIAYAEPFEDPMTEQRSEVRFAKAREGDLCSLEIRQRVLRVRIRLAPPFSLGLPRLRARSREQSEKFARFRGVLAVEPACIRTGDREFGARTTPQAAAFSVAKFGGSDSLSIRL
jgi:hypothetical protein